MNYFNYVKYNRLIRYNANYSKKIYSLTKRKISTSSDPNGRPPSNTDIILTGIFCGGLGAFLIKK